MKINAKQIKAFSLSISVILNCYLCVKITKCIERVYVMDTLNVRTLFCKVIL